MQYGANLNNNGDDLKQIGGARASCTYMWSFSHLKRCRSP
jgi:hypothetical protein